MAASHELYIRHCFNLAKRSGKHVQFNPNVGAVIVANGRIIGEGWHQKYGEAHAEVNAFKSVNESDRHLIKGADLYVSLEPCNRIGKTGPCSKAILEHNIKRVFVASLDPTIGGESLRYLESQGVECKSGINSEGGQELIAAFSIFQAQKRPYVILKYAQSKDFYMGKKDQQYWISNEYSKMEVHKWRSQVDGILIGVNTLLVDNPKLSTRSYPGDNPLPIVIDPNLRSDPNNQLFQSEQRPIVFTATKTKDLNAEIIEIDFEDDPLPQILDILFSRFGIAKLLVEGGAKTLRSFIREKLWDEARIITGNQLIREGIKAPSLIGTLSKSYHLAEDLVQIIKADQEEH